MQRCQRGVRKLAGQRCGLVWSARAGRAAALAGTATAAVAVGPAMRLLLGLVLLAALLGPRSPISLLRYLRRPGGGSGPGHPFRQTYTITISRDAKTAQGGNNGAARRGRPGA